MKTPRIIAAALALSALLSACKEENQYQAPPPPTVTVSPPLREKVTNYLEITGTTAAYNAVDLVARVEGYLTSVNFEDGSMVEKDKLLFVIEQAPYIAQVKLYEATIAQEKAQLLNAQTEYDRQIRMLAQNATAQATVDKWRAQRDEAAAGLEEARANAEVAKINLGYTRVLAPFAGRIGRHLIDPGNVVGAGAPTKLATLEQVKPLYAYFTVNERDLLRIRKWAREQGMPLGTVANVPVFAGLQDEQGYPHRGVLDFVATGLDTKTGTIQVRGIFANDDISMLPGLFVRMRVPLGEAEPGLLVPDRVVNLDQVGQYVLVVGNDNTVQQRRVKVGSLVGGLRVITDGLTDDDLVVIDGMQAATPGSKVTTKQGDIPASPPPARK
ncbi:MAG: efflux RND transporter periplasmic adaptor subunit [Alphaproteobacteria bacterium]